MSTPKERMTAIEAWLDDLDAKYGPPSEEEMEAARVWWNSAEPVIDPDRQR